MGGAIRGQGNSTPAAEFNVYSDPEAAAIVFDAWSGLTLVSFETTLVHPISAAQVDTLMAMHTLRAEFFRRVTQRALDVFQQALGYRALLSPDALAVAVALEPDIVCTAEAHYVQVEVAGQHTRGNTAVDWFDRTGQEPNVNLVLEMDRERFWELMQAAVS